MTQEEIWRKYITDVHTKFKRKGIEGEHLKKYTIDLALKYKETANPKIGERLFDCMIAYVFHLWGKRKSTFCGYDLYENMGSVYEEVLRTAELYDISSNVPYHLYFARRLWARFSHMRESENYFNLPGGKGKKQLKSTIETKISHDDMMRVLTELENDIYESW